MPTVTGNPEHPGRETDQNDMIALQRAHKSHANIQLKHKGTEADHNDMVMLGRTQELQRNFRFISMLGFSSTLICTWEIVLVTLSMTLTNGGTAGLFWGFLAASIGFVFVYASIAEMASMSPTSAGQYHWVSEFAPPKCQKFLSFLIGWLCATSWETGAASASFLAGSTIQGIVALNNQSYTAKAWHTSLLVIAIQLFCVIFNTFLAKNLPNLEGVLVLLHIFGAVAIAIVLIVLSPRNDFGASITHFNNGGGWNTHGTSALVGLTPLVVSVLGFDCSVHMSEEIKDASRTLPISLMTSVGINIGLGFGIVITVALVAGDLENVIASPTGFPFLQIFENATKSIAATNIMAAIIVVALTASAIAVMATASRQLWSFSRDKGVPFWPTLRQVHRSWNVPQYSILAGVLITIVFALINIGSTAALNAIFSLYAGSVLTSYIIAIGSVLLKRLRGETLPPRRWSLGCFGMLINVIAILFLIPIFIFSFFPSTTPVALEDMNWGVVMYSSVVVICIIYYVFKGKKFYVAPVDLVRR